MSLCILASGKVVALAVTAFTLGWTHSIEKTRWEEDWRMTPAGLELVQSRIKGSGAGMEPAPDAKLENGWWVSSPSITPRKELVLASSGATGGGWTLCAEGRCLEIGAQQADPIIVRACRPGDQ
ncbi:MAG: DUF1850 domain-containing protein [Phyllobacterium sp.]